jgi:hypothetical protein
MASFRLRVTFDRPTTRATYPNRDVVQHRCAGGELPQIENITMSIGTILVIVLVLMLLGALPSWPHSRSWGYYPSGGLGLILVILVVLLLLGRI